MRTRTRIRYCALIASVVVGGSLASTGVKAQNRDCLDTLAGMQEAFRFVDVATRGHVESQLRDVGPFTVFVPTNEAIAAVAPYLRPVLFPVNDNSNADVALVRAALNAHILQGRYTSAAVEPGMTVTARTLAGTPIQFTNTNGVITIMVPNSDPVRVVRANIPCSNGVIHIIDRSLVR
ncbi:fasciclin domain-containing protein [Falsiroseomonas sp. HW251]|uniref:fasciclin domain-containing protein n=1 Tax=Falsiroseomonas sp. HW251 TaxID=3390998 RepID=UPI003D31417F